MAKPTKKSKPSKPEATNIPRSRFRHGSMVHIEGTALIYRQGTWDNEKHDYAKIEEPTKLSGFFDVELYDSGVILKQLGSGDDADEVVVDYDDRETISATVFEVVKTKSVKLNDGYTADVLPTGDVRVGCQLIDGKAAEKAALAVLTARGYVFK